MRHRSELHAVEGVERLDQQRPTARWTVRGNHIVAVASLLRGVGLGTHVSQVVAGYETAVGLDISGNLSGDIPFVELARAVRRQALERVGIIRIAQEIALAQRLTVGLQKNAGTGVRGLDPGGEIRLLHFIAPLPHRGRHIEADNEPLPRDADGRLQQLRPRQRRETLVHLGEAGYRPGSAHGRVAHAAAVVGEHTRSGDVGFAEMVMGPHVFADQRTRAHVAVDDEVLAPGSRPQVRRHHAAETAAEWQHDHLYERGRERGVEGVAPGFEHLGALFGRHRMHAGHYP